MVRPLLGAALCAALAGCPTAPTQPVLVAPRAPTENAAPPSRGAGPHLRFEPSSPGDVALQVRAFAAAARAEDRTPLVYVGATWCEPCRYFHAAAQRGDLDRELPRLALLEFDLDRDAERLRAAGYASEMIPLFAIPTEEGRGTGRQVEGSIHGPGSPMQLAPRLRALLRPTP